MLLSVFCHADSFHNLFAKNNIVDYVFYNNKYISSLPYGIRSDLTTHTRYFTVCAKTCNHIPSLKKLHYEVDKTKTTLQFQLF